MIHEIQARSALHHHERTFATNWDLNVYRGCGHRCAYCFAQYSHRYLGSEQFFQDIFVKTNIAEPLARELARGKCQGQPVAVCGVSDAYQPIERRYGLMPGVLKTFAAWRNPIVITTKSTLLLRDVELIRRLREVTDVRIGVSVSTLDEDVRRRIEPGAAPTADRLRMLKTFKALGCATTVLLMPVIPGLTDGDDNLEAIFRMARESEADSINVWPLHLRGATKQPFMAFFKQHWPERHDAFARLYRTSVVSADYHRGLKRRTAALRRRYGLFNPHRPRPAPPEPQQLDLFG